MNSFIRFICVMVLALTSLTANASLTQTKSLFTSWVIDQASAPITHDNAKKIVDSVYRQAYKNRIDPLLVLSMINIESGFRPKVRNRINASGLLQVVPRYHGKLIRERNILDIAINIEVGTTILQNCLVKHKDNFTKGISCYSGGSKSYERKLRKVYASLKKLDVEMRFTKELPIVHQAMFGKPRLAEDNATVVAAINESKQW